MLLPISRLWREPLLHFLVIGCVLFFYYEQVNVNGDGAPKQVHVSSGEVAQLVANYERTRMRQPTPEELDGMIESYVREEIFYREAMAMGLEQNDPLVRRRLRMKLEFMLEELSGQDASDEVLSEFLARNPERFRKEAQLSFHQVYLDPGLRPGLERDAVRVLSSLRDGSDPENLGDPTLVPRDFNRTKHSEVSRILGEVFADQVTGMAVDEWGGPIYSPFGAHLVKISSRTDARAPALEEVYDEVLRDYLAEKREQQKDMAYQKLREGYEVTVDPLRPVIVGVTPDAVVAETR